MAVVIVQWTARDAELAAENAMQKMGYPDATVTPVGPDNGIDVQSRQAIAQVKNWSKPVGRADLQRLYGARNVNHHLRMLFFSRSGYSKPATEFADQHQIALFSFGADGAVLAVNRHARSYPAIPVARSPHPARPESTWWLATKLTCMTVFGVVALVIAGLFGFFTFSKKKQNKATVLIPAGLGAVAAGMAPAMVYAVAHADEFSSLNTRYSSTTHQSNLFSHADITTPGTPDFPNIYPTLLLLGMIAASILWALAYRTYRAQQT